jgi:hypothetical protein
MIKFYLIFILITFQSLSACLADSPDNNLDNSCATAVGGCSLTPSFFEMKVYQIGLCKTQPMVEKIRFTPEDYDCTYVYNSESGEWTGNVLIGDGVELSSEYLTLPVEGKYSYIFAVISNQFRMATHHMVTAAGTSNPVNSKRYVSTSSGGAVEGEVGKEEAFDVVVDTFTSALDCSNDDGSGIYNSSNYYSDNGIDGDGFSVRLTNDLLEVTKTGSGSISDGSAICNNVKRIFAVVIDDIEVGSSFSGINFNVNVNSGATQVDQGNGDGVVLGFSGSGTGFKYNVSIIQ